VFKYPTLASRTGKIHAISRKCHKQKTRLPKSRILPEIGWRGCGLGDDRGEEVETGIVEWVETGVETRMETGEMGWWWYWIWVCGFERRRGEGWRIDGDGV